jgi:hypothetical protein
LLETTQAPSAQKKTRASPRELTKMQVVLCYTVGDKEKAQNDTGPGLPSSSPKTNAALCSLGHHMRLVFKKPREDWLLC